MADVDDTTVVGLDVESDAVVGVDGGFFGIRRTQLRNVRADGSRSAAYGCDFIVRPKGVDAVVVALYHQPADGSAVRVLLRRGLRPALALGRPADTLAVPDAGAYLLLTEVVAGIIENADRGEDGIRRRAVAEAHEEAGYRVDPADVEFLGAGSFPSPGSMPERYHLVAIAIDDPDAVEPAPGDGSPMEEGATCYWESLDAAIAQCGAGEIEDGKTELVLRRLRDRLC